MGRQCYRPPTIVSLLAWIAINGLSAAAQPPPPPPATETSTAILVSHPDFAGVQGLSYSADETTVTTQTLADGTTIKHQSLVKVYRDSEGRTRREFYRTKAETETPDDTPISVQIFDPVTGVSYQLVPRTHTARKTERRRRTPPPLAPTIAPPENRPPVRPRPNVEDLGTQVVEGVNAHGLRVTHTFPADAEGNDRPIEVTVETWSSPELDAMVMQIRKDPRYGETVTRLTNIVRDEPPAELFQVPPDYTVEELQTVAKPASGSE